MSCSIIIPTYNRKRFEELITHNILCQDYYNILEVIVLDDGDDEPLNLPIKIPIHYLKNMPRCSIGHKRNVGCGLAKGQYIAFMDTDDVYYPNYISNGIFQMRYHDKDVAGSADMIIYNGDKYFKQCCVFIHYLNEATIIFKRSYWETNRFSETNSGEAVSFLQNNAHRIIETTPHMICLAHKENTIDKTPWLVDKYLTDDCPDEMPAQFRNKAFLIP